jgi:hypothetical protein
LLGENEHKTNILAHESLILNEGCLPFVEHSLQPPSSVDRSYHNHYDWSKLVLVVSHSYVLLAMPQWLAQNGGILYLTLNAYGTQIGLPSSTLMLHPTIVLGS